MTPETPVANDSKRIAAINAEVNSVTWTKHNTTTTIIRKNKHYQHTCNTAHIHPTHTTRTSSSDSIKGLINSFLIMSWYSRNTPATAPKYLCSPLSGKLLLLLLLSLLRVTNSSSQSVSRFRKFSTCVCCGVCACGVRLWRASLRHLWHMTHAACQLCTYHPQIFWW